MIMADLLKFPNIKASRAVLRISRREKKKTHNFELYILQLSTKLSKMVKLNDYKKRKLAAALKSAEINLTPETYIARAYVKAGLVLFSIIPALFILPIITPVIIFLSVAIYFKEIKSAEDKVKKQREEIEYELPRFAATLTQELKASRDINAGGESNGRINPLQIRPTPVDDNDEVYKDEGQGMGDMALYIKNLEIFFSLYIPSLTDRERAILKDCIIELYNSFNITRNTDINGLNNEDFPIFLNLYNLIEKNAKEKEKTRKESEINIYADLALLLKDIAMGSDSFLWNGHSSIKTKTRCICLDTHDL